MGEQEQENETAFSTPTGPRREEVTDPATGLLGNALKEMDMTAADPPLQRTRARMALELVMGGLEGSFQVGAAPRSGLSFFGGVGETNGSLKKPIPSLGVGSSGGDNQVRLFQYDAKGVSFCGGLVRSKNKPKCFCISTSCGLGHGNKVFDQLKDGDYYIIEPGAQGGGFEPNTMGLFGPFTPQGSRQALARQQGVLEFTNSMEGWLSLFQHLVDAEARGDGRGSNPELAGFASRARKSTFKTPLRDNGTKRLLEETLEDETEDMPPIILVLQDTIIWESRGSSGRARGLKNLEEDMRGLQEGLDAQLRGFHSGHQAEMGALKFEAAQASARSSEVKRWMEQTPATGGGTTERATRSLVLQEEVGALRSRCDFLEGAFTQMALLVVTLKDKVDMGIDVGRAPAHSPSFVLRQDFNTMAREVQVALNGFQQEMKGAPLKFGGYSFQGLDSCVVWTRTNMPEATYQCVPGMIYGLCLIREAVLYKQDMRDNDIQAHRVQQSPMQLAVVESVKRQSHRGSGNPLMVRGVHPRDSRKALRRRGSR